jgi:DnaJ-class molecular chaperone
MRQGAEKACRACQGSGVVLRASEYPGFEDYLWCQECGGGRAKADRLVLLILCLLPERTIGAA